MAPDGADQYNLRRHADDEGRQPTKRQRVGGEKQEAAADDEHVKKCTICHEPIKESDATAELSCRHQFHQECIDEWFDHNPDNPTCPLCRAPQPAVAQAVNHYSLHQAIGGGDNQQAETLIAQGVDVNSFSSENVTPLQMAIHLENSLIIDRLLAAGANPNLFFEDDSPNWTPLELAVQSGNASIVQRLLVAGALPNQTALSDAPPILHQSKESSEITKILLEAGTHVHARDHEETTALHLAAARGDRNAMQLLIAHHADVNAQDNQRRTPLLWALQNRDIEISVIQDLIAAGSDINLPDRMGHTPLFYPTEIDFTAGIQALIARGADVNAGHPSPISIAIQRQNLEAVILLLQAGACVDKDCIMTAALYCDKDSDDSLKIIRLLILSPQINLEIAGIILGNEEITREIKALIR